MSNDFEFLDTSWIKEQERFNDIENNHDREPMNIINTFIVYVNQNDYIDKIICEKQPLDVINDISGSVFTIDKLTDFVHSKKIYNSMSKYRLQETLLYNINLEHDELTSFTRTDNNVESQFLNSVSFMTNIYINPSLFIFHNINSLIFIFKEYVHNNISNDHSLKSILKNKNNLTSRELSTKKVKIQDNSIIKINHKKTRRFCK
jgi:hypothetical protein|tara:strand:- start:1152 stop:1763 length:612 start_codon:yes stop_codon:yes gene_type:complete